MAKPGKKAKPAARGRAGERRPFPVVGIGASAGGYEAMNDLIKHLPAGTGMAFVVVQHLDPKHESMLATLLQRDSSLPVREARQGVRVEREHIYVIPPNASMVIENQALRLMPRHGELRHMSIDTFLESLAADLGSRAIGMILSGTGSDGVKGMEAIKAEGGITFAQEEKSARFPEMPRNAAEAGCVDFVLPPAAIAGELARIGRHPYVAGGPAEERAGSKEAADFMEILALLRKATQVDFTHYKRATIRRRIARRLALHRMKSLDEYVRCLKDDPSEAVALYQDVLIKVTGFFREPGTFAFLKSKIFPAINKNRSRQAPIRIWVPGCSTGEEAYSIAICLIEFMDSHRVSIPCQILATDLSEEAVEKARAGSYSENIMADVSPERLRRFFTRIEGGYQIAKTIRDLCVVARQDLVKDPPFSRLDLVSCRNVLIYLEPTLQRKAFQLFHYALKPGGYLVLGASETVGSHTNLFGPVDRKHRVYVRKLAPVRFDPTVPEASAERPAPKEPEPAPAVHRDVDIHKEVDRLILGKYTPGGVVINEDLEILQFRGWTDRFLQSAPGKASLNVLKMAREGMLFELRGTVQKAKRDQIPVRSGPIHLVHDDKVYNIHVEVIPLMTSSARERQFLVLFDEDTVPSSALDEPRPKTSRDRRGMERRIEHMRQELGATKEHLQSIIEEQETTNEELKSANEEILSSNEELQSTNEELETAKEELQSTNEELTTLNEELQTRNAELTRLNDDMMNLLSSVSIPIVMLGSDLRIRRFTPPAEKILNLIPSDLGRPLTDIKPTFEVPDLEKMLLETIETVTTQERDVRDRQGRWFTVRVRPYRTRENKIDGAVLMLIDIDAHKRMMEEFGRCRDFAEALFESGGEAVLLLDGALRVRRVNRAFYAMFQLSRQETEGRLFYEIDGGGWDLPGLRSRLERVASENGALKDEDIAIDLPRLGPPARRRYLLNARRVAVEDAAEPMVLLTLSEHGRPAKRD